MKLKPVLFGVIVGAVVAASVTAWATIPDSTTGAVTACSSRSGSVRVIDAQAGKKCKRSEKKLVLASSSPSNLLVKDGNGNIVGQYVYGDISGDPSYVEGYLVVLGLDGHLRSYSPGGTYRSAADVSAHLDSPEYWFETSDCSGTVYFPKFAPVPGRESHDQWGLAHRLKLLDGSYLSLNPSRYGETDPVAFSQMNSYWGAEMDGDLYPGGSWGCHPKTLAIQNFLTNLGFRGGFTGFHSLAVSDFSVGPDLTPPLSVIPAP